MFQRKNKVENKIFIKDDYKIEYTVSYKKIKHTYFRFKDDILHITTNSKMKLSNMDDIIHLNLDKILALKNRITKQKFTSTKYQLWGESLSEADFFGTLTPNDKNMFKIYEEKTMLKIKELENLVLEKITLLGLELKPTRVKKLKAKYGYCNIVKKEITINSFLAKLDPIYLYYVLLHEYAHLVVPNHQRPFYDCLDKVMKNHKEVQKSLRKHTIMF